MCVCEELKYTKRVTRHGASKRTLKERHEAVSDLFIQYVNDAESHIV